MDSTSNSNLVVVCVVCVVIFCVVCVVVCVVVCFFGGNCWKNVMKKLHCIFLFSLDHLAKSFS